MQAVFKLFWDIALWRRVPRDVPSSAALLLGVAALYVATSTLQAALLYGLGSAVVRGVADLAVTGLAVWVCLAAGRRRYRLRQTLIAVLGTGSLLSLPMIALMLLRPAAGGETGLIAILSLASLVLVVWYLLVIGHIVRHALDAPLFTGMTVAMTYFVVSYLLLEQVLPAALT
jgi:hypothetical protein